MNLVQLQLFTGDNQFIEEWFFITEKPVEFFIGKNDYPELTFIEWLKNNNINILNRVDEVFEAGGNIVINYFHEDSLEIV